MSMARITGLVVDDLLMSEISRVEVEWNTHDAWALMSKISRIRRRERALKGSKPCSIASLDDFSDFSGETNPAERAESLLSASE